MPMTDYERLDEARRRPRIVEVWLALQPLRSVVSFLQSGAHPDDETSEMLAALRFRDGLSTAYVCATRGEGGQNDIGTEAGADLGTLRTAEMERAAERLDMRLWWLSDSPSDPIGDFGFSKSGAETLARWGRDRTLARFVEVVRRERPDILCPTFLDVGGQHGHHRAMTALAHEVFAAAADPAFPSGLPVWEVQKLYLPGWGGGGSAYDDDAPPPPATVTVRGGGSDPVTGWGWGLIGQQSRMFHRTQGMGRWLPPGRTRDWPLHLALSRNGADRGAVTDNLPATLADLGSDPGLAAAQGAAEAALAAFPDLSAVAGHAARALAALEGAAADRVHAHRIARKRRELARVALLAAGVDVRGRCDRDTVLPGESLVLSVDVSPGLAAGLSAVPLLPDGWQAAPAGREAAAGADPAAGGRWNLLVPAGAVPSDPCPPAWDPLAPALPALAVAATVAGQRIEAALPFERAPLVAPAVAANPVPEAMFLNLARPPAPVTVALAGLRPAGARPHLALPAGWAQDWAGGSARLTPPAHPAEGLIEAALTLDGLPARGVRRIAHPHAAPRLRAAPALLRLRAARVELPPVRVGYCGTGNDRVAHWLRAMGLEVAELEDAALAAAAPFSGLDAVVVGVFGFRRAALAAALPALHAWVAEGGTLLTLYHRPGDNWDPARTPPLPIEIGAPSLRWRVTDETAAVTHLAPGHPVLASPNPIGPGDWQGWHKERGLYFARAWDPAYVPLLSMADPGETPLRGALLSAEIGRGRHSHVALGLHHQLDELVAGAFRLMANLLARR